MQATTTDSDRIEYLRGKLATANEVVRRRVEDGKDRGLVDYVVAHRIYVDIAASWQRRLAEAEACVLDQPEATDETS